jgi:YVTN family beta-propeller protein
MAIRFSPLCFVALSLALPAALVIGSSPSALTAAAPEEDRSPIDVAVSRDGKWAVTANNTADSVSLVDLDNGKVAAEVKVGHRPFGVDLTADGRSAVVTNSWSNSISLLAIDGGTLKVTATVRVGDQPRGVALSPDGSRAYIALSGDNSVVALDLKSRKLGTKLVVGIEPWHVAVTRDGRRIAVGNARSQDVTVVDALTWTTQHSVKLRGKNARHLALSPDGEWAYVPHISERGRPTTKDNIDLGWVVGNRLSRVPINEVGTREAMTLDTRGKAVADVDGLTVSPDGKTLVLSAGGTHELLVLRLPLPFVKFGGPGDHIEPELLNDPTRFRRIPLGGRPVGLTFLPDGKRVVAANYLGNALQVVDTSTGAIVKTVSLGGPAEPSLARKGEAIFLDANRCFNQWYSCNSCHVEGHTNGSTFDTFNDSSYETPKKTLSLRNVTRTKPWTWHGWRKDLDQLVHDSMTKSMQGPEPTPDDIKAVAAYLETLRERPNPYRLPDGSLSAAAKRGEVVFNSKNCQNCHVPPFYTSEGVYSVGLESPSDVHKGYNAPSLLGLYSRAPYMHNAEAPGLTEVLTKYHRPSQLTGATDCTPQELADLIAFLKSL